MSDLDNASLPAKPDASKENRSLPDLAMFLEDWARRLLVDLFLGIYRSRDRAPSACGE